MQRPMCLIKYFFLVGLPDPPSKVQAEFGPQPGTLLISWKPVTNQPKPPSRAAVESYIVFGDGQSIAQISPGTGLFFLCFFLININFIPLYLN